MFRCVVTVSIFILLMACSSDKQAPSIPPPPVPQNQVSFYITDAPVDDAFAVVVTYAGISLKAENDAETYYPILDNSGNEITAKINLLNYQNGDRYLFLSNLEIPAGDYKSLIIHTFGCETAAGGSTDFCYVENSEGIHPLGTPSNKLKLGPIIIEATGIQEFTIEFNLRYSLVERQQGFAYNLKPHGVMVLDNRSLGHIQGSVDSSLVTAAQNCSEAASFVYLYEPLQPEQTLADSFDPAVDIDAPLTALAPLTSVPVVQNSDNSYGYKIANVDAGNYTIAFSCNAANDDPELYNGFVIPTPAQQQHNLTVSFSETRVQNFSATVLPQ
ncbi:DUF4382 domain-containing protein [Paraferrimonas sp. SM1919]|uniref:DUF4382 domain-containing protein n=1 Tax=Paraferrimonas sp. SM1919 TaxID=2662263 RepID=UPI0013D8593E|nr:DUF4382 domain-containing protein [Paraferrimonas sp. SM1919]